MAKIGVASLAFTSMVGGDGSKYNSVGGRGTMMQTKTRARATDAKTRTEDGGWGGGKSRGHLTGNRNIFWGRPEVFLFANIPSSKNFSSNLSGDPMAPRKIG